MLFHQDKVFKLYITMSKALENIVETGENVDKWHFFLFPLCFPAIYDKLYNFSQYKVYQLLAKQNFIYISTLVINEFTT